MGATHFSGPVKIGSRKDTTASNASNMGDVVLCQNATVTHTETAGTTVYFTIPKNARIMNITASGVITGTSPTLSVGTNSGTANDLVNAYAMTTGTAFAVSMPTAGTKMTNGFDALSTSADTPVYIKLGGTGLSAGDISVSLLYVMGANDNGAL